MKSGNYDEYDETEYEVKIRPTISNISVGSSSSEDFSIIRCIGIGAQFFHFGYIIAICCAIGPINNSTKQENNVNTAIVFRLILDIITGFIIGFGIVYTLTKHNKPYILVIVSSLMVLLLSSLSNMILFFSHSQLITCGIFALLMMVSEIVFMIVIFRYICYNNKTVVIEPEYDIAIY